MVNYFPGLFKPSRQALKKTCSLSLCFLLTISDKLLAQPQVALEESNRSLILLVITLLVVQSLLIIGLQKSRINQKRSKNDLAKAHKELEERVADRTRQLQTVNRDLYHEISHRENTEQLLLKTQDYLHSILNSMPSVLMGVTREGYITHWNAAAEASTGLSSSEALGMLFADAYPHLHIELQDIIDATQSRIPILNQNIQRGRGNESQYYDVTIYPLVHGENQTNAVIRIDDVTLRIQMENMLIQNEKMLSLGELAAGLAHEINNPLAAILNSLQNLERRTSSNLRQNHIAAEKFGFTIEQLQKYFLEREINLFSESIRLAAEQASKIVQNMLSFSRGSMLQLRYEDINALLKNTLEMAENTLTVRRKNNSHRITIIAELGENLPHIACSASEIQQVVFNLLRNASQAFPSNEKRLNAAHPTIWVRTKIISEAFCIQVEDNGIGMSDNVRQHIFEPFFTTKDVGQGTGLGLSISYFIITEHHNGDIEVESTPGKGTCFTIRLPIAPTD